MGKKRRRRQFTSEHSLSIQSPLDATSLPTSGAKSASDLNKTTERIDYSGVSQPSINALEEQADSYEAVRKAVEDAGSTVLTAWVAFVSLATYLSVVVASVADTQLFLESPIKLPLVDVNLPLYVFFCVAPLFFLIFHAHLLLQMLMLTGKIRRYNELLAGEADPIIRRKLRQQLPNHILVQFLAAPKSERAGIIGKLSRLIAWITLVIGPLLLLLLFQYKFLSYQDEHVSWLHRACLAVDFVVLWFLWGPILTGRGVMFKPDRSVAILASSATLVAMLLSTIVLTFPDETIDRIFSSQLVHSWAVRAVAASEPRGVTSNWLNKTPQSRRLIKGTLKLRDQSFVDEEKVAQISKRGQERGIKPWESARTLRVEGQRRMRYADLAGADLRFSDMRNIDLEGAFLARTRFDAARLELTNFYRAEMTDAELSGAALNRSRLASAVLFAARMDGATLNNSNLRYADLRQVTGRELHANRADLRNTSLDGGDFTYSSFREARLESASGVGTSFNSSDLTQANLNWTRLDNGSFIGANLAEAQLLGARLRAAKLRASSLANARLWGANLAFADLEGANLIGAELQISVLAYANFHAAVLISAQLHGAHVASSKFTLSSLVDLYLFGARELRLDQFTDGAIIEELVLLPVLPKSRRKREYLLAPQLRISRAMLERWKSAGSGLGNMEKLNIDQSIWLLERKLRLHERLLGRRLGEILRRPRDTIPWDAYQKELNGFYENSLCNDTLGEEPHFTRGLILNGNLFVLNQEGIAGAAERIGSGSLKGKTTDCELKIGLRSLDLKLMQKRLKEHRFEVKFVPFSKR